MKYFSRTQLQQLRKMLAVSALAMFCTIGWAASAGGAPGGASPSLDPLQRQALIAVRAPFAVTLAIAAAGERAVAAGERGVVLWSDDGKSWQQASVPVSVTLTALSFPTPQHGWVVGHGGVVLHSADGGQTWSRQFDGRAAAQVELKDAQASGDQKRISAAERLIADGPDKPLLGVYFWNPKRGFVIGAYGLIFGTEDGGTTWTSWAGRVQNPKGLHLNALHVSGESVFIVGEQGLILRSQDNGHSFKALQSPYEGSWFAVTGTGSSLVVAGLRGTAFRSTDAGSNWARVQVPAPVTIGSALAFKGGALLFANQDGQLLISVDGGQSFRSTPVPPGAPLTSLAMTAHGALMAASLAGPRQLPSPSLAVKAGQP